MVALGERASLLGRYLGPQRGRVTILAVLLLSSIGLQLLNPQILRYFIDSATGGGALQDLMLAGSLFIGVALLQQIAAVGATYFSENVGWTATNALRADLLLHCLRLDQSFHKARTPGELIERIDGDVTALSNFFSQMIVRVFGNILLLAGVLVILWSIEWRVGLLLTIFTMGVFASMPAIHAYVVPAWKRSRQVSADLYGFIEERLSGTEDIRASDARDYTMVRLYHHTRERFVIDSQARVRTTLVWLTPLLLFALANGAMFVLTADLFRNSRVTIGTLYLIFFYIGLTLQPIMQMVHQIEDFQKASAGITRIQDLLAIGSVLDEGQGVALPAGALPVAFEHVSFGYEDGDAVLEGVGFRLAPGRVLGLLGRTGSGKTTLTRLLFRLYDPGQGAVRVGGVDLRAADLGQLRRRVGIVTQEVQLFHATVRDNLTFFDETISDERIMAAIRDLGLEPWLRELPQGLDTVLAAGGGGLSAGEAQLLAFTRIFLRDPGLVILDEASSRLDPATEQLIERAVDKLLTGRTGIMIAHRLHTVHRADEILILENGRIVEHGERELLVRDPESRFAALLRTGLEEALV